MIPPTFHPSPALLEDFVSGAIHTAPGLALATHLDMCARCRGEVRDLSLISGALLERLPDVALCEGALARVMARLGPQPSPSAPAAVPLLVDGRPTPSTLAGLDLRKRRDLGPGAWVASLRVKRTDGWRTVLLRLPPGGRLPLHGHLGLEMTCILRGGYKTPQGWAGPGDFLFADPDTEHELVAAEASPCLCLVAIQGPMRWLEPVFGPDLSA